jgi:hypothetical protein
MQTCNNHVRLPQGRDGRHSRENQITGDRHPAPLSRLKWHGFHSIVLAVSKVEQMESELRKLSQAELRQIREWLDDFIEDELEFTPEFEASIQRSERDMAAGKAARVREPEHD